MLQFNFLKFSKLSKLPTLSNFPNLLKKIRELSMSLSSLCDFVCVATGLNLSLSRYGCGPRPSHSRRSWHGTACRC